MTTKGYIMKAQKNLSTLATLSILCFGVACNDSSAPDRYAEGFAAGKTEGQTQGRTEGYNSGKADGYKEGYAAGDRDGYERARVYFASADYNRGVIDGRASGYTQGYTVGRNDGLAQGYTNGYNAGYDDGEEDGIVLGYSEGYNDGDADGYADGLAFAKTEYTRGYRDGYDDGYDDGDFGAVRSYGLSIGQTPRLSGYADVLSAFHNDLIDYSKIQLPQETRRGLVANGQLLLSETSLTNKDTLKRAAVVEQYLVLEMAQQVKGKFGLSAERSLKIAKAANHFRKFATTRALTADDTNAYAEEIIGVNFQSIERAFDSTRRGNLSDLSSIMEKAGEKNGVSPEKMTEIVTQLFI
jgi:hypothetical protein